MEETTLLKLDKVEICREENIKRNMQKRQAFSAEDGWIGVQRKIQHHQGGP